MKGANLRISTFDLNKIKHAKNRWREVKDEIKNIEYKIEEFYQVEGVKFSRLRIQVNSSMFIIRADNIKLCNDNEDDWVINIKDINLANENSEILVIKRVEETIRERL